MVRVRAYRNPPADTYKDIVPLITGPFLARIWSLRASLGKGWSYFSEEVELFPENSQVDHGKASQGDMVVWKSQVDSWAPKLINSDSSSLVLCGTSPLSLWMYLGMHLRASGKDISIVNKPFDAGVKKPCVLFKLPSKETDSNKNLALLKSKKADLPQETPNSPDSGYVIMHLTLDPAKPFTLEKVSRLKTRPKSTLEFSPAVEEPIRIDGADIVYLKKKLTADFQDVKDEKSFILATSGVDASAFVLGSLMNPTMVESVVFCDYSAGYYYETLLFKK